VATPLSIPEKQLFFRSFRSGDSQRVLEEFLARGHPVEVRDARGNTPLILAAARADVPLVERLLELGADPGSQSTDGATALLAAVYPKHSREKKADVDRTVRILIDGDANVADRLNACPAIIIAAACQGFPNVVSQLLDAGADVNARNGVGFTPLHEAAEAGHTEVVSLLLRRGANPQVEIPFRDLFRYSHATPLSLAIWEGHRDIALELLERGAATLDDALMMAVGAGQASLVDDLLARGADPGARAADGTSVIEWARELEWNGLVEVLKAAEERRLSAPNDTA
jgi:ankyrin repeat protein